MLTYVDVCCRYYNGWILEITGGKGAGQPPAVVASYDGKTRTVALSESSDPKYATYADVC